MRTVTVVLLLTLTLAAPLTGGEDQPQPFIVTARLLKVEPPALGLALREWQVPTEIEYPRLIEKLQTKPGPEARTTGLVVPSDEGTNLSVSLLNRVNDVQDHEVVFHADGPRARPVLRRLTEGVIADLSATCGPNGESVVVEARVTAAVLKRPIQTFDTSICAGPPLIIELPEIDISRVRKTIRVPLTGGAILRTGDLTYLVVTVGATAPAEAVFWHRRRR